jgi:hypothetical protein
LKAHDLTTGDLPWWYRGAKTGKRKKASDPRRMAMFGILRGAFVGFLVLSLIYVLVATYSRSVRREKLEKKFDAGGIEGDRDAYIAQGLVDYEHGLRHRLLWLVYILPAVVIAVTIYFVNYK